MRDDREHRLQTAGRIIPEMHVRLLDDDGRDITEPGVARQPGVQGRRPPASATSTTTRPTRSCSPTTAGCASATSCEIDADGYLRVVGRTSDIIIRGGKNISAPAVEAEVAEHPAIAVAAAVAMPDEVFGERVCLYAELQPGTDARPRRRWSRTSRERGVSPEWFPERLVVLDALPRASGGKVAKGELRARNGT